MATRCINIDWLEIYCHESRIGFPHDAAFFAGDGWNVWEREYGTPVYAEMFILKDQHNEPLIEVRRKPKSAIGQQIHGVLDPLSCHIRLSNRACYFADPVAILLDFISRYGYTVSRISRIDICLDFEKFDYGDSPADFMRRYMAGKYSKIYQANIAAHGKDSWRGRVWNSVSWGKKKSMVGTKFYCKSLELQEAKDKPYIRQAWKYAGLIDDEQDMWKINEKGQKYYPDIWRVEFSIQSGTKGWFVIDEWPFNKQKKRSIKHSLDMYRTKQQLLDIFFSLADHYFHFKKVGYIGERKGVAAGALSVLDVDDTHALACPSNDSVRRLQRKDRCADKMLFRTAEASRFYHIENVASSTPRVKMEDRLLRRLYEYRETHLRPDIYKACNVLIESLETESRRRNLVFPWPADELTAIRLWVADRIMNPDRPFSVTLAERNAMASIEHDLFGEFYEK